MSRLKYNVATDDRFRIIIPKKLRGYLELKKGEKLSVVYCEGLLIIGQTKNDYKIVDKRFSKHWLNTFGHSVVKK